MDKESILISTEEVSPRHPDAWNVDFPLITTIKSEKENKGRPLKVCIATEDIVGPIRNGGIGTTYTHLAFLLAEAGHDTTILYLRGVHSEGGNIDYWINWYKQHGVRFVPVDRPRHVTSSSHRWIEPMYALYKELQKESYDLVHVSEWRGSAYLCLLAKRQGLAFQNTVFCVKTSSPWLWNREGRLRTLSQTVELVKMYAERRSVEMADLVIGGSAYLLRWMLDQGYRLPKKRCFVQPNILKPIDIPESLQKDRPAYGTRVPVKEIVFFGRLEHRKGLDLFCEAIHNLLKEGRELPPVTFMGKFGVGIPSYPGYTSEQYILEQAAEWPMEWKILDKYNQSQAITYLHGDGRLAVMPSVAENSTLTVYETTNYAIPFIATDVGGTSELIEQEYHDVVLMETHPVSITNKLKEVLDKGGMVAAPSFDNNENLNTWVNFHSNIATIIGNEGWPPISLRTDVNSNMDGRDGDVPLTSVCLVLRDNFERMDSTVKVLLDCDVDDFEVLLVDDGSEEQETRDWLQQLEERLDGKNQNWKIFRRQHFGQPSARNFAAEEARGDYLMFIDPDTHPKSEAIHTLAGVAEQSGTDILLSFYSRLSKDEYKEGSKPGKLVMFLAGDPSFTFYKPEWRSPAIFIRKETFKSLGGFSTDYEIPGSVEELIAEAILANKQVESVPENLFVKITDYEESEKYDKDAFNFRTIRPYIKHAPLCYQPILMAARGMVEISPVLSMKKLIIEMGKSMESRSPRFLKPLFKLARYILWKRWRIILWFRERKSY